MRYGRVGSPQVPIERGVATQWSTAASEPELLRLLTDAGGIDVVLLDYLMPNAELGESAVCSNGLRCRHRSPSPMEYVRDEAG
jgi:hypothetical protein